MKFKLLKYVNNIFFWGGGSSAIVSVGEILCVAQNNSPSSNVAQGS
jgi:hypothetical protein